MPWRQSLLSVSVLFLSLSFLTMKATSISHKLQIHYFMHFAAGWAVAPILEHRCVLIYQTLGGSIWSGLASVTAPEGPFCQSDEDVRYPGTSEIALGTSNGS